MNPNSSSGNYNYSAPNTSGDIKGYNPDYSSIFGTQNQNSQNFNQGQNNQVAGFTSNYNAAAQALPTFQQLNQQANQQYNVPALQNKATQLNNTVLQIPQTYSQATQGSDTNNNQLMQLIGQKQWELDPLAQAATNSAQTAQGLANTSVGYGVQNEAQLLSPYANTVPLQQALTSGAYTNFTQSQSDQLKALQDKVDQGVTLTKTEMDNLNALKVQQAQNQGLLAAAQANNQYKLISPSQGVYNAATNQATQPYNPSAKQIPGTSGY